jgi:hypothetical protein
MDYGNPKVLPATGGGILLTGTLFGQFATGAIIAAVVIGLALLIRRYFRRKRSIGE